MDLAERARQLRDGGLTGVYIARRFLREGEETEVILRTLRREGYGTKIEKVKTWEGGLRFFVSERPLDFSDKWLVTLGFDIHNRWPYFEWPVDDGFRLEPVRWRLIYSVGSLDEDLVTTIEDLHSFAQVLEGLNRARDWNSKWAWARSSRGITYSLSS